MDIGNIGRQAIRRAAGTRTVKTETYQAFADVLVALKQELGTPELLEYCLREVLRSMDAEDEGERAARRVEEDWARRGVTFENAEEPRIRSGMVVERRPL